MDGDFRPTESGAVALPPEARTTIAPATPRPAYDARRMMQGGTTAHVVLDGQVYCLRITRSGKLILTK